MACRIQRRREWMVRIMHELDSFKQKGIFLTLTYDEKNLPENMSLQPNDLQLFWKRLRKKYKKKIKYYSCGEYGDLNKRPHYHAIIFGLQLSDLNIYLIGKKMISKDIEKIWLYGYNQVGTVTTDSASYVAGYIEKKLLGKAADYNETGRVAPFSRCSQGIGKDYVIKNESMILDNLNITIKGKNVGIPRYYKKLLKQNLDPMLLYDKGQEKRDAKVALYAKAFASGGDKAVDQLRLDIESYRRECIKAGLERHKRNTLDSSVGNVK